MPPVFTVSSQPDPEAETIGGAGLDTFNDAMVGYADRLPLNAIVTDSASGAIVGGIIGRTSLGLLFVDLVWLSEAARGQDTGTKTMALAEDEARRRGCQSGVLYTIGFQAPAFYRKPGWRVFSEIPCDPPGTSRVFLTEDLR